MQARTIVFWTSHLEPKPQPASKPTEERAMLAAMYGLSQQSATA
jgi:hypothetical protein